MNDIQIRPGNLPANIDDLAKFALIGREKLVAVRAEIRAIERVGLAQEVREQKLREAQEISEAVLDAEVRIGELMAQVPKAQGKRTDVQPITTEGEKLQTKADIAKSIGLDPKHLDRFETLAAHPEIVAQAKAEAREDDDIVSRSMVLDKIRAKKQEERRQEKAQMDERIEASRQSTQTFLDTVKRQHGVEDDNMVDLSTYQVAKRDADYLRQIDDARQIKALWHALNEVKKLPEDDASYESMWRGSIDPLSDVNEVQQAIDRLNRVMQVFIKKGGKDIDKVFDEMLKGDEGPD